MAGTDLPYILRQLCLPVDEAAVLQHLAHDGWMCGNLSIPFFNQFIQNMGEQNYSLFSVYVYIHCTCVDAHTCVSVYAHVGMCVQRSKVNLQGCFSRDHHLVFSFGVLCFLRLGQAV